MRQRLCYTTMWFLILGGTVQPASAAVGDAGRIRSSDPYIETLVRAAIDRSATFRTIVRSIEETNGMVYIEPGQCRHGVRACLSHAVVNAGGLRWLRVTIDRSMSCEGLIEAIGHELRHALEVLADPALTTMRAVYQFYSLIAQTTRGAFETEAALQAGSAVEREIGRCRK